MFLLAKGGLQQTPIMLKPLLHLMEWFSFSSIIFFPSLLPPCVLGCRASISWKALFLTALFFNSASHVLCLCLLQEGPCRWRMTWSYRFSCCFARWSSASSAALQTFYSLSTVSLSISLCTTVVQLLGLLIVQLLKSEKCNVREFI